MVKLLALYDKVQGTELSVAAASTYCSLVTIAADYCGNSVAVKMVVASYIELLRPYILSNIRSAGDTEPQSSSKCPECAAACLVLGITGKETKAEIARAYTDLAKVWHPDRFSEKDERLRRKAGEQMREVNLAYGHLKRCESAHVSSTG
jgi:hypothetical protein